MAMGKALSILTFGLAAPSIAKGANSLMNGDSGSGAQVIENKPLPMPEAPKIEASQEKALELVKRKKVAQSKSIYTSPLGVSGQADVARKTLLGQ